MQQINGNEVILSRSFIMWEGESLLVTPDDWKGISFRLNAVSKDIDDPAMADDLASSISGSQITYDFAFLRNGQTDALRQSDFISVQGARLMARLARQSVGVAMLVQIDVHYVRDVDLSESRANDF